MDLWYLAGLVLGGAVGGALVQLFLQAPMAFRIKRLENVLASGKGVVAREEQKAQEFQQMTEAAIEAMQLHSEGKSMIDILKTVGLHHPQVAMSLIEKVLTGKLDLKKLMQFKGGFPSSTAVTQVNQNDVDKWQRG